MTDKEFINGIINGDYNENDVIARCKETPNIKALFLSMYKSASTLIQSKGVDNGYIWCLSERRFNFDNPKDLRIYTYDDFTRIENAMAIVADAIEKTPTKNILPKELQTDQAQKYFASAIKEGLMSSNYEWLSGLQMLACFAREMSLKLNMGKGNRISWKPFEMLFGIKEGKLRLNMNDIQNKGQSPKDIDKIERIFEE